MPTFGPRDPDPELARDPDDDLREDDRGPRDPPLSADVESRLLDILRRPLRPGEGHAEGHRAKELELRVAMSPISALDALVLQHRIEREEPGDELAALFGRMILERRGRLIDLLIEIRRRAAVLGSL